MVELLLLAAALSADNFAVSIGYGSSNTRISPGMTALLNLFCSAALVASAQFGKRFLQSAGPEWGTRVGAGCFFLMGTLKIFEELRKRRRKSRENQKQDWNIWKTAPPTGIWPAGGFDVGGWNCLRRLCRGSSGDRRTDLFCLLRGRNGGDVCRNCHRKKTGQKTAETEHCSEEFCSIYWRF